jgi:hypothetical protein
MLLILMEIGICTQMISAGLDAFRNILGFFKTDYVLGNIDVSLEEPLLLFTVAGRLAEEKENTVHLPLIYEPDAQVDSVADLAKEMSKLIKLRARASDAADKYQEQIAEIEKAAADPANASTKTSLLDTAGKLKGQVEQVNGVIKLYDSFAASLTTPDANGTIGLAALAQEFALDKALKEKGAFVLLLRLESKGGGYLIKKNLWTGLGKMPLYHMGGATISYVLLNGPQATVVSGGVIPVSGGFVRTDALRNTLKKLRMKR